ncbi:MAG: hypothetical protein IJR90_06875 [Clostridia bacterium]|nr:hypothetical protein [Clostridia bacterium]
MKYDNRFFRLKEILCGYISSEEARNSEELRIKRGARYVVRRNGINVIGDTVISNSMFDNMFSAVCRGSYHTYADSAIKGFIPAGEGIRVGVSGQAVCDDRRIINIKDIDYMVIRIPRFIRGICGPLTERIRENGGGVMIYSPPGVGKTTVLRDLACTLSSPPINGRVILIDARNELYLSEMKSFPLISSFCGYPKGQAVEAAIRASSPDYIISDEIGSNDEAKAISENVGSGVAFIASAHASSVGELLSKPAVSLLDKIGAFNSYCGIERRKNGAVVYNFFPDKENA